MGRSEWGPRGPLVTVGDICVGVVIVDAAEIVRCLLRGASDNKSAVDIEIMWTSMPVC